MSVQLEERVALLEAEVERLKHQMLPTPVKREHPMLKFAGIFKDDSDNGDSVAQRFFTNWCN